MGNTPPIDLATVYPAITASIRTDMTSRLTVVTDEDLESDYRKWWVESYGVQPNKQAVVMAVAWSRQLVTSLVAKL